jgi:4'-phosphopantetheinyl transferase
MLFQNRGWNCLTRDTRLIQKKTNYGASPALPSRARAWSSPPDQLALEASDVHVWLVSLNQPVAIVNGLLQLVSPDEQAKADRFQFEIDRRRFIVARGCLRTILAGYLGIAPAAIQFSYGNHGKPKLATQTASASQLKFNLAHSGDRAVYAFTLIGEVGVDLERIRPDFDGDEVARRFFSPSEVACLNQFSVAARQQAFFQCWTRKEAFIKAKGLGLSIALDQFDVTLAADEEAALLRTRWDESEAARWSLQEIDVGPDYAAAVAIEAEDWKLSRWCFDEVGWATM